MVGKVLSRRAIMPAMLGLRSTISSRGRRPRSRGPPACPPRRAPITRTFLLTLKDEETRGLFLHHLGDRHPDRLYRLLRVCLFIFPDPGDMLPDVRHLEEIAVEARLFNGPPEGELVHAGGAGGHHDAVEPLPPDRLLDLILSRLGAGIHVIGGIDDARQLPRLFRDPRDVDRARDVVAAVADKYADSHLRRTPSVSPGMRASSL